ncbi:hypothetical protein [Thalassobellus sediminis]|uniref:hypothetical protein n=1 Tax=Thalassobellus sediminis TaxID=3367753 RepID=UPI003795C9D5
MFKLVKDNSFSFNTGILSGVLRQSGKSTGLVPVTLISDSSTIALGEGLFNHYRVFTKGKRYGYGARRWPSTAKLKDDGSLEVVWPVTLDRPFELRGTYRWVTPNTIDLTTTVYAKERLEAFEVFLASYYKHEYIDSRVWASSNPLGNNTKGFVSADKELGEWLAFPRDLMAQKIIDDGRWNLEPHPLKWTFMPNFDKPLAIRRDPQAGTTIIIMTKRKDCFGVFTPYNEEKHISNYLSLFGYDIEAGSTVNALSRLVILSNPTDAEILKIADAFLGE